MNVKINVNEKTIKTERLILRPFKETDLNDFYEYASVEGVGENAGWIHHKSIDESKIILKMFIDEKKTFALEYFGKVIGSLGIEKYHENEFPELQVLKGREIGCVLSKDYWGHGLMPEAIQSVIKWLFNELELDFLVYGHSVSNNQSKRVAEKCGFKFVKDCLYDLQTGLTPSKLYVLMKH
jgi:ribosomal-protein-alanine N-acetyltransferase